MSFSKFTGLLCCAVLVTNAAQLKQYNIPKNGLTVSGVSSGGAMAIQFHVAFCGMVSGCAAIASPPYWCATDDVAVATSACMDQPDLISVTALVAGLESAYELDSVDDPSLLKDQPVWLLTGTEDTVVVSDVVMKTQQFYQYFHANTNLTVLTGAEHAWVTNNYGNPCNDLAEPYMNNCDFDAAGQMLQYLYGSLNAPTTANSTNMLEFEQAAYIPIDMSASDIAMGPSGFVYVPQACHEGEQCRLNIAFHGCNQNIKLIGDQFYTHAYLNEWAEANNIVILYPQAISTDVPYNPEGCWDWWGYTGADYASQLGFQMIAIKNMVNALTGWSTT